MGGVGGPWTATSWQVWAAAAGCGEDQEPAQWVMQLQETLAQLHSTLQQLQALQEAELGAEVSCIVVWLRRFRVRIVLLVF